MSGPAAGGSHVVVVTRADDVHAFAARAALERRGLTARIVEVDRVAGRGGLTWDADPSGAGGCVLDVGGCPVAIRDAAVTWWRRFSGPAQPPLGVHPDAVELVQRDAGASLLGLFATEFTGTYISDPEATRTAENKLVQLRAARRAGLAVPPTIVSASPEAVLAFCQSLDWRVVVKPVSGAGPRQPIMTGRATPDILHPEAIRLCPAIYQELVEGQHHLRVNVFGRAVYTALLVTSRLDWRYPLDCAATPYELDAGTTAQLFQVLDDLGLRMGVFDLKLTASGEVVWLEVNPQGQFLWLEGLCGMPLGEAFADFLAMEVAAARR